MILIGAIKLAFSSIQRLFSRNINQTGKNAAQLQLTAMSVFYFTCCMIAVATANSISDRINVNVLIPLDERKPLPDLIMRVLSPIYRLLNFPDSLSDILNVISIVCSAILLLTKMDTQVIRRFFYITGSTFLLRAFTVIITVLPNPLTKCEAHPTESLAKDVFLVISLQKTTCGDVFFSGHTIFFTISILLFEMYAGHGHRYLKLAINTVAISGMVCLVASQYHYTIDVLFGYLVTQTVWTLYHYAIMVPSLKSRFWASVVCYLDGVDVLAKWDSLLPLTEIAADNDSNSVVEIQDDEGSDTRENEFRGVRISSSVNFN